MRVIPVGLLQFQTEGGVYVNLLMAATVLSILPILAIYFVAQRFLIEGVARSHSKAKENFIMFGLQHSRWPRLAGLLTCVLLAACGGTAAPSSSATAKNVDQSVTGPVTITFWHSYSGSDADAMNQLLDQFKQKNPQVTVKAQALGGYGALHKKIVASLQANQPPNAAIAYESDVADYVKSNQVLDLAPYVHDAKVGLDSQSLADILPVELKRNTYTRLGGRMLSFPWTVADLMMYTNLDLLAKAGKSEAPKTWQEFQADCQAIKAQLSLPCHAISLDASPLDAVAFTFGAEIFKPDGNSFDFGSDAWKQTLNLYSGLVNGGYAYPANGQQDAGFADQNDFVAQKTVFIFRTVRSLPVLESAIGTHFKWNAAPMPISSAVKSPTTVLFGPDISVFDTKNSQQNLASWLLVKYLSSSEAQAYWALHTGNLPIRESAAQQSDYQAFLASHPNSKVSFDQLPNAQFEGLLNDKGLVLPLPSNVRTLIEDAETALVTKATTPAAAQQRLTTEGNADLASAAPK